MKKILLLGGSSQQVIAIVTAKRLGYYTILCDYLPDNPGQKYADQFYLVSTTDKDAILDVAKREKIDGVLAYASDPAAPTAAYVSEKLMLRTNPYKSVETLCNKDKFRSFLKTNGFNSPCSCVYFNPEQVKKDIHRFRMPVLIKPVDSSGSKGVTVLSSSENMDVALQSAFFFSRRKGIIVEEFIEKKHPYLIGGDIFVWDGQVILWGLLNCHRDNKTNPLVPVGKSYPPELEVLDIKNVKDTIQRMVDELGIQFGAMNVELVVDERGRVWPIDIGPRNGGNMIPDLLGMIFMVDIVEMTIKATMGESISGNCYREIPFYATHNVHSDKNGIFDYVYFSEEIEKYIVRKNIYKTRGDKVEYFDNASKALGIVFLKFDSGEEMKTILAEIDKHIVPVLME